MALPTHIDLQIVTPERMIVQEQVDEVQIPGSEGYFGVLPGHTPLLASLAVGELWYRKGTEKTYLSIAFGFAEVLPDRVTILARLAERAEEIDIARAEAARTRAQQRVEAAAIGCRLRTRARCAHQGPYPPAGSGARARWHAGRRTEAHARHEGLSRRCRRSPSRGPFAPMPVCGAPATKTAIPPIQTSAFSSLPTGWVGMSPARSRPASRSNRSRPSSRKPRAKIATAPGRSPSSPS